MIVQHFLSGSADADTLSFSHTANLKGGEQVC